MSDLPRARILERSAAMRPRAVWPAALAHALPEIALALTFWALFAVAFVFGSHAPDGGTGVTAMTGLVAGCVSVWAIASCPGAVHHVRLLRYGMRTRARVYERDTASIVVEYTVAGELHRVRTSIPDTLGDRDDVGVICDPATPWKCHVYAEPLEAINPRPSRSS